ncbi:MAG: DUF3086 domain-containing protein [Cyanobacteria bacterium J06635_15]
MPIATSGQFFPLSMSPEDYADSDPTLASSPPEVSSSHRSDVAEHETTMAALKAQERALKQQIETLQANYERTLRTQAQGLQADLSRLMRQNLNELEQRKQTLQTEVEKLERRQERIQAEMRTSFAGVSQDLAIRVQGFKEYLVGSLQDLVTAAEQLELVPPEPKPSTQSTPSATRPGRSRESVDPFADFDQPEKDASTPLGFANQRFQDDTQQIRNLLDQYRLRPDYYGPIWQLRRTFEPVHADRLSNWFLAQGGRGAIKSMGSRLQNVLIASASVSILRALYGDRVRILVLANTPERLGEWRRGLQDCLGVSRADFGTNRGIMLFEAPEPMAQRADRLVEMGLLPLMLIDEAEDKISLALLQFPLWLAFAPDPLNPTPDYDFYQ